MDKQLSRGAARFQSRLVDLGHEHKVEQFIGSAKTAEEVQRSLVVSQNKLRKHPFIS